MLYDRAYALSDLVLITLDDEMTLRGETDADRALAEVLALGIPEVVVKRGVQPTLVRIAGTPLLVVPVEEVPRVVDTTAAGDSFAGAYLAMRLTGIPPAAAARAANRMAGVVIQHPGAIIPVEAMPTRTALLSTEAKPSV
jgi:2-dehydro-3-deoxygluconokinase